MEKKQWLELIKEKREEIEEKAQTAYKRAIDSTLSGWNEQVEIDEDGDVYLYSGSQNSQTGANWKGEAMTVCSFSNNKFDYECVDSWGWIEEQLLEVEKERFFKYIKGIFEGLEYPNLPDEEDYMQWWGNRTDLEQLEYFQDWKEYGEIRERLEAEELEAYVDEYSNEAITDQIDATIEELEREIQAQLEDIEELTVEEWKQLIWESTGRKLEGENKTFRCVAEHLGFKVAGKCGYGTTCYTREGKLYVFSSKFGEVVFAEIPRKI